MARGVPTRSLSIASGTCVQCLFLSPLPNLLHWHFPGTGRPHTRGCDTNFRKPRGRQTDPSLRLTHSLRACGDLMPLNCIFSPITGERATRAVWDGAPGHPRSQTPEGVQPASPAIWRWVDLSLKSPFTDCVCLDTSHASAEPQFPYL